MGEVKAGTAVQAFLDEHTFEIPESVTLRRGPLGLSVHVTRPVQKGDVIFTSDEIRVPNDGRIYRARALINGSVEDLTITPHHTVRYHGIRTFDIPGSFLNHACDPTSFSLDSLGEADEGVVSYAQIATRDMLPGDEITCDYNLFDWDCDGHRFLCACGAPNCYGFIGGFGSLPAETQRRLAGQVHYEAARVWKLAAVSNG